MAEVSSCHSDEASINRSVNNVPAGSFVIATKNGKSLYKSRQSSIEITIQFWRDCIPFEMALLAILLYGHQLMATQQKGIAFWHVSTEYKPAPLCCCNDESLDATNQQVLSSLIQTILAFNHLCVKPISYKVEGIFGYIGNL